MVSMPEGSSTFDEHVDGCAIECAGGQDHAPAIEQGGQDREVEGSHSRTAGQRAGAGFERCHQFFERVVGRAAVA